MLENSRLYFTFLCIIAVNSLHTVQEMGLYKAHICKEDANFHRYLQAKALPKPEISPPTVTGSSFLKVLLGWPGWFTLGLPCLTAVVGRAKSAVIPAVRLQENEKPRPCPPLKWVWGSPSRSSGYDSALHCPWVLVQSLLRELRSHKLHGVVKNKSGRTE